MIYYLLVGFLIGTVGLSVLMGLSELISTFMEFLKAKLSVKIVECNIRINELNNNTQETHTRVIGFATTSEEEEEDYG